MTIKINPIAKVVDYLLKHPNAIEDYEINFKTYKLIDLMSSKISTEFSLEKPTKNLELIISRARDITRTVEAKKLTIESNYLNNNTNHFNIIENLAIQAYALDFWQPNDEDESQLMRNIKIRISFFENQDLNNRHHSSLNFK